MAASGSHGGVSAASPTLHEAGEKDPERLKEPFTKNLGSSDPGTSGREAKGSSAGVWEEDSVDLLTPWARGHYPHLDITRICCVWLVAIDHGAAAYGKWNCLFSQEWVLQYLYLVCGVSYGLSSKSLLQYELRLATYFFIGVFVNWTAWLVMGMDWVNDFFNVVFHQWFVAGLMIYAALLAPLRTYLIWARQRSDANAAREVSQAARINQDPEAEHPGAEGEAYENASDPQSRTQRDSLLRILAIVGGGLMGLTLVFHVVLEPILQSTAPMVCRFWTQFGSNVTFWGLPHTLPEAEEFLQHTCRYVQLTLSNVFLIIVCPLLVKQRGWTGWSVLLNTYLNRMLYHRGQDERPWKGLDLMMLTLTCYYLGLKGRRRVGEYVVRYWFVVLLVCTLLWPPGAHGRFDENPPSEVYTRIRINLLEAIFVVVWLVASERLVQPEIFTEDGMDFLNTWALIVFLVHKAVHIMFIFPLNWLALLAIAPACYLSQSKQ